MNGISALSGKFLKKQEIFLIRHLSSNRLSAETVKTGTEARWQAIFSAGVVVLRWAWKGVRQRSLCACIDRRMPSDCRI